MKNLENNHIYVRINENYTATVRSTKDFERYLNENEKDVNVNAMCITDVISGTSSMFRLEIKNIITNFKNKMYNK